MRRLGSKGSKRRKSETSSDADSGENEGNGGSSANDTANFDAGNDHENDDAAIKATPISKRRSRVRSKRDDDASSVSVKSEFATGRNDAESNGEQASDDAKATPDGKQEIGNNRKSSAKRRKKEKSKSTASTSQENDNEYEVEKIVAHRTIKGRRQFLVRWKDYGEDSDTWEQEKDLNCPNLIEDFMADEEMRNDEEKAIEEDKNEKAPKAVSKSKRAKKISTRKDKNKQNQSSRKEDNKEFEVEKIIEVHFKKNKGREFLIRWKGFNASDDTWEPEENLNCPDLIVKFMERVDQAKSADARELRTNPAHTKRYTLSTHESGRRWSRRNVDKQRTTYYQCDE